MNGSTNSFKNKKNKTDKPNINNKYNQMNYNKLTLKDNSYYTYEDNKKDVSDQGEYQVD